MFRWLSRLVCSTVILGGLTVVAEPTSPSVEVKEITSKSTGMKLVLIPTGEFTMGSPDLEKDSGNAAASVPASMRSVRPFD